MPTAETAADLVMVPVPVPLYPAVIRLIADHQAAVARSAPANVDGDGECSVAGGLGRSADWSSADYAKAGPYLNAFTRSILDLCARQPGQWVAYRDAVAHAGISHFSARSQLGGLTRRLGQVFDGTKDWPFDYEAAPDRQLRFRLDAESAAAWKEGFTRGDQA